MKLYDVPQDTWVIPIEHPQKPPESITVEMGEPIHFINLDGMYSYCKNAEGKVVHLPAWLEVNILEK
jgi:hypothetical protein